MYVPKPFLVEDTGKLYDFIERNSFGMIVSTHEGELTATHLPLVLDREEGCLYGHFAKPNPQWNDISGQESLVVFSGPHAYISSSWYETNHSVPTWNYVAVHAYGNVELMVDRTELLSALKTMVDRYEGPSVIISLASN